MVTLRRSAGSSRDLADAGFGIANVDTAARTAQGGCPFTVALVVLTSTKSFEMAPGRTIASSIGGSDLSNALADHRRLHAAQSYPCRGLTRFPSGQDLPDRGRRRRGQAHQGRHAAPLVSPQGQRPRPRRPHLFEAILVPVERVDAWLIAGPGGTKTDLQKYFDGHAERRNWPASSKWTMRSMVSYWRTPSARRAWSAATDAGSRLRWWGAAAPTASALL
jgi:hypothetical protein